jgi:hypothetical protein
MFQVMPKRIVCNYSFMQWIKSRESFVDAFIRLGSPRAHDVTLLDGLQSLPIEEQMQFRLDTKKDILLQNLATYKPSAIDLGSLTSSKLLPIMKHNKTFFKKSYSNFNIRNIKQTPMYIQIFNLKHLDYVISHDIFQNLALSCSLSDKFQQHNTQKGIEQTTKEMQSIVRELDATCYRRDFITMPYPKLKLTLSCFNRCPFLEKAIPDEKIVGSVVSMFHNFKPDLLVLKDTTGLLKASDMSRILNKCFDEGVKPDRVSMHFHELNGNERNVQSLINAALDLNVRTFEVSSLKTGGCAMRDNKLRLNSNIPLNVTYELFYKSIVERIVYEVSK